MSTTYRVFPMRCAAHCRGYINAVTSLKDEHGAPSVDIPACHGAALLWRSPPLPRANSGASWRWKRRSCQDIALFCALLCSDASCILNETFADGLSKTSDL
eukprot:6190885-Pleurochrysis_carterae.AAC.4